MNDVLQPWQHVLRVGLLPQLSEEQIRSLLDAVERDDPRLIQGATTSPPPLLCVSDWLCEGACLISYCGWQGGDALEFVGDVEEFFAATAFQVDQYVGEPAGVRHLLTWFDDTPRGEMRRELGGELRLWLRTHAFNPNERIPS